MIIVFPMLCSSNVSPNILPGICKVVEKYLLIYGLDDILKISRTMSTAKSGAGSILRMVGARKLRMENDDFLKLEDSSTKTSTKTKDKDKNTEETKEKTYSSRDTGRTSVTLPKSDNSISIEPTWVQVETPQKGLQILGIKVIPFQVNSDEDFIKLLTNDTKLKSLNLMTEKLSRKTIAIFWRILRGLKIIPFVRSKTLTGDPRQDILFASTKHGARTIALINKIDIENSEIFSSAKMVQKLHKLNWPSFIMVDDVDKTATFCMKEFNGLCSRVAYNFIYSSISKDHMKVYEDLEDVRKTSSPFFSKRVKNTKVFGEGVACFKSKKYIETTISENELLTENIGSFIKDMTTSKAKSILNLISSSLKEKNPKKLSKVLKIGENVKIGSIEKICSKTLPDFDDSYKLCQKVIKNSLDIKGSLIKPVSCFISIVSNFKKDDPKKETRENLKKFVGKMRTVEPLKEGALTDEIIESVNDEVYIYGDKLLKILGSLVIGVTFGITGIIAFFGSHLLLLAIIIVLIVIILLALLTKDN